ncbi:MAG: hypothetical protein L0211_09480 [Planctomycetaceae bacterium]|nr:hypothetical protein [Planctomycetaceae bacterium]
MKLTLNSAISALSALGPNSLCNRARQRFQAGRRGVAVVLVLGMLAMTLALCYAAMRGQFTIAKLAENVGRGEAARLAAESGVYAALRRMSEAGWAGAESQFSANLTDDSWYDVAYTTGDPQLMPADPIYGEYAYRVTITSTGYASDPGQPAVRSIHKIEAIAQLARRAIQAEPENWVDLEPYAVHQWGNRPVWAQFPLRVQGPAHMLGTLSMFPEYPLSPGPEHRYFQDLEKMRVDGVADYRPFANPVKVAVSRQTQPTLDSLQDLGISPIDSTASTTWPVAHPISVVSYKLYPGGKSYLAPVLQLAYGSSLQNRTIEPDPKTNPLGIYRSQNTLTIYNNVQIRGTIISEGTTPNIQVHGTGVQIEGVNLAPLEGTSQTMQLPVAIIRDDLRMHSTSDAVVHGLAMVYDEFEVAAGPKSAKFDLTGQLMTAGMAIRGRNEFALLGVVEWELQHTLFLAQFLLPNSTKYFPVWMEEKSNLPAAPQIKMQRDASGVKYHWHTWSQPVYVKDPADAGLRWNLVRWTEQ